MQARMQVLNRVTLLLGIVGICAVAAFQLLLVTGVLSFEQEVGPVMIALLVSGVWLIITGYHLGRSTGSLPRSLLISLFAAIYFGYPLWAITLARLLCIRQIDDIRPICKRRNGSWKIH